MATEFPTKPLALLAGTLLTLTSGACKLSDTRDGGNLSGGDPGTQSMDSGDGDEASGTPGGDTGEESTPSFEEDEADDSGDDESDNDDSGGEGELPFFDLGMVPDFTILPEYGCAKADFLFVIDNSGSMGDEQAILRKNFAGFMEAIETTLMIDDFHVMVVDTDSYGGGLVCWGDGSCTCFTGDTTECCGVACTDPAVDTCERKSCDQWPDPGCAHVLGSGRIENTVTGDDCNFATEDRYITKKQPDPTAAFECAARVGTDGDGDERSMQAMMEAVSEGLTNKDECNSRFIRDDAILVVTIITDEEDKGSIGNPQVWHDALVAAKGGNELAVVVLGLIGDRDLPMPICQELDDETNIGAEASPKLRQFVKSFGGNGLDASVCADDYRPFFEEAVGIVDDTCDIFDPAG